ncbi:MAG: hydantoinase B/oxoprolinase family protein, partial [Gammaproteobacteria bacterium]|nr:hydantoinase B/oxoprolinase family protein [Gammaproteobacteria bacterium]
VTLIAPVYVDGKLTAFVVNRAHHADIGADTPGSMPVSSSLAEEGLVIPPTHYYRQGLPNRAFIDSLFQQLNEEQAGGDFAAQTSANLFAVDALSALIASMGRGQYLSGLAHLNDYGQRLAYGAISSIPEGIYAFEDVMDDDGQQNHAIKICMTLSVKQGRVLADFNGTARQVPGNINCPLSVAAAGVFFAFRCLMPAQTPACAGVFRDMEITAPRGCLVNADFPAAVAAGNVETSTRVVDVTLGALAQAIPEKIPAASHGSMNNVAMGSNETGCQWNYYETIGGGMGAGANGGGLSAVQTHMTNTLNTPVEVLESTFPLLIREYALRAGSGGDGKRNGGNGIVRSFEFLKAAHLSVLTERRHIAPWGREGGANGQPGLNLLNDKEMPAKFQTRVSQGDVLEIRTPGGGGYQSGE